MQVLLNSKREVPDERSGGSTPDDTDVFPMVTLNVSLVSPFASCDSLANDQKDHSDGIWNESQVSKQIIDKLIISLTDLWQLITTVYGTPCRIGKRRDQFTYPVQKAFVATPAKIVDGYRSIGQRCRSLAGWSLAIEFILS